MNAKYSDFSKIKVLHRTSVTDLQRVIAEFSHVLKNINMLRGIVSICRKNLDLAVVLFVTRK